MNILLWVLQVVVALFCVMGAVWRFTNFEQIAKMPSVKVLPKGAWSLINIYEIVCGLGLILPAFFQKPNLIFLSAAALVVEMALLSALHVSYFGLKLKATNPATWTIVLAILSAIVAYGRMG
jgi:hypothetical protein